MKGSELELWIASLATCNFITVQSNGWMLIFDNYWKVDLWEADTWQGYMHNRCFTVILD